MIYVTQGHEESIGLEVFLKSISHLNQRDASKINLICNEKTLLENLTFLKSDFDVKNESLHIFGKKISLTFFENKEPQSTTSLKIALKKTKQTDILFTLPTSKDQLVFDTKIVAGHTEFFRKHFKTQEIAMIFESPKRRTLLVTDHIPLQSVSKEITSKIIFEKVSNAINSKLKTKSYYFAGINPHAGENGILGHEDEVITQGIEKLNQSFNCNFSGPYSGDTLHTLENKDATFVYMYHDQGLAPFKLENQFIGANISLGLPFIRVSPDHGTAFNLYSKNSANYFGTLYSLKLALAYYRK